jgi:hypothetical protein
MSESVFAVKYEHPDLGLRVRLFRRREDALACYRNLAYGDLNCGVEEVGITECVNLKEDER